MNARATCLAIRSCSFHPAPPPPQEQLHRGGLGRWNDWTGWQGVATLMVVTKATAKTPACRLKVQAEPDEREQCEKHGDCDK
mmetsp:Transcript_18888/g.40593  ORF Transcript_18888/g.40593 Transcript_18888/m.40593 type:complete len:82 (+) Transcript_18888:196-441(+)